MQRKNCVFLTHPSRRFFLSVMVRLFTKKKTMINSWDRTKVRLFAVNNVSTRAFVRSYQPRPMREHRQVGSTNTTPSLYLSRFLFRSRPLCGRKDSFVFECAREIERDTHTKKASQSFAMSRVGWVFLSCVTMVVVDVSWPCVHACLRVCCYWRWLISTQCSSI